MFNKHKNARWGSYPCCDFVNNALRFILDGEADCAVEELLQAIWRADGYIYDDLKERVNEVHKRYWDDRNKN